MVAGFRISQIHTQLSPRCSVEAESVAHPTNGLTHTDLYHLPFGEPVDADEELKRALKFMGRGELVLFQLKLRLFFRYGCFLDTQRDGYAVFTLTLPSST